MSEMIGTGVVCEWIDGEWFAYVELLSGDFGQPNRVRIRVQSEYGSTTLWDVVELVLKTVATLPNVQWFDPEIMAEPVSGQAPRDWRSQIETVSKLAKQYWSTPE